MTVYEALQAYTVLGAWAGKEEHLKGTLALGMLADFAILEEDIFTVPHDQIDQMRVTETHVSGRRTFARET